MRMDVKKELNERRTILPAVMHESDLEGMRVTDRKMVSVFKVKCSEYGSSDEKR